MQSICRGRNWKGKMREVMDGTKLRYQVSAICQDTFTKNCTTWSIPQTYHIHSSLINDGFVLKERALPVFHVASSPGWWLIIFIIFHFWCCKSSILGTLFFLRGDSAASQISASGHGELRPFFLEPSGSLVLALGIFDQFLTQHGWMMIFHQHGCLMMSPKCIRFHQTPQLWVCRWKTFKANGFRWKSPTLR